MEPHPRCILWHWACCTPVSGSGIDVYVLQRQGALRSDYDLAKQFGLDFLRDSIRAALRGYKLLNFSYYLIGAALWPELEGLYPRILQSLTAQEPEVRLAATFACAYYMEEEQVACLLAERAVVEEGDQLTVQGTREVLEITAALKLGGVCPRCKMRRTDTTPRLEDLAAGIYIKKESRP